MRFFRAKKVDEIIAGCCKDDASCQEALFRKYAPLLMTVCRRYEHPEFGASDILQEAFISIFKNIQHFDAERGSIEAWMRKIAVNTALKVIRQRKISFLDIESNHFQFPDQPIDEVDVEKISEEQILKMIHTLPKGYQAIFNLFVIDGLSHQEIADSLGISTSTSKSQLYKAKRLLRKKISASKGSNYNKSKKVYT